VTAVSTPSRPHVVMVNNSEETYTPTNSGAIATWIWEVAQVAGRDDVQVSVVTRGAAVANYPGNDVTVVPRPVLSDRLPVAVGQRTLRRVFGWRTVGLGSYTRHVLAALRRLPAGTIVVCHNDPELAVVLARALDRCRVIHWFHNPILVSDRWRRRYRVAPVRTVAVSAAVARSVELLYELPGASVEAVINGVDLNRFTPRDGGGDRSDPVRIGFVGRTGWEKGLDVLLEACLRLAREGRFALQVVGSNHWGERADDPYQRRLDDLFDRLEASGFPITRLGHVGRAELPGAMRDTDIHVVPSRWDEPCSLSLLEGMATGLAVVATATGGTPEVLGSAGMLVPRDDPDALADTLRTLLDDDLRRNLGCEARRRAEGRTWGEVWRAIVT
jgi:glycosyltransferase involved in cell wall biosynthesis